MTYLEVAKELLANISNSRSPQEHIALAQAHATIALAETQRELVTEQRRTNEQLAELLSHKLVLGDQVFPGGLPDTSVLDSFTEHPRKTGDEEQVIVGLG